MKSITPSNEQLEIDQLAEAEVERLQKQVLILFQCQKMYIRNFYWVSQVRKLDKERSAFICEKKNGAQKRERLIETLKKERAHLQDRLNAITTGPHVQHDLKVI